MNDGFNNRSFFYILLLILIIVSITSLIYGPVDLSIKNIFDIIISKLNITSSNDDLPFNNIQETVVWNIRLPRLLLGIIVGLALGSSGAVLQGLFRNPLVDPGFIGVSSGAAVGAMLAIMFSSFFFNLFKISSFLLLPVLSMLGAFIVTIIIYKLSKVESKTNIMAMLLSGIAINAFAGAIIGILVSISSDAQLRSFTFWTLGGLDRGNWDIIGLSYLLILGCFVIVFLIRDKLDIFMLGDAEAYHLGIDVERLKKLIILISSLMVGITVSFCGMIGFIGLVTPHLVRLTIGPIHKYLIPCSAILGSIILVLADLISKTIIAPAQLPVGVITSSIGAPIFIWLIYNQRKKIGYTE